MNECVINWFSDAKLNNSYYNPVKEILHFCFVVKNLFLEEYSNAGYAVKWVEAHGMGDI